MKIYFLSDPKLTYRLFSVYHRSIHGSFPGDVFPLIKYSLRQSINIWKTKNGNSDIYFEMKLVIIMTDLGHAMPITWQLVLRVFQLLKDFLIYNDLFFFSAFFSLHWIILILDLFSVSVQIYNSFCLYYFWGHASSLTIWMHSNTPILRSFRLFLVDTCMIVMDDGLFLVK